jgi:probable biosynthetic protein (TIGR04098 family)
MLAPEQLSEVELLKLLGDLQWSNLCEVLDSRSSKITNESGERLYASFISIHLATGNRACLAAFQEGDPFFAASSLRFFSGQFLEGFIAFDKEPLDGLDGSSLEANWPSLSVPKVYLTNALVARVAGNERLKVYRPAGIDGISVPETATRPAAIDEHSAVLQSGEIAGIDLAGPVLGNGSTAGEPIVFPIVYENDMNGAGLLYFARYIAMMNFAERNLLRHRSQPSVSHGLVTHLSTVERKVFYFANAPHHDRVLIHVAMTVAEPGPDSAATVPSDSVCPLECLFRHDLFRESDGELMASSLVKKRLLVPRRRKGVLAEVERFKQSLARRTLMALRETPGHPVSPSLGALQPKGAN